MDILSALLGSELMLYRDLTFQAWITLVVLWAIGIALAAYFFEKWKEQRERARERAIERKIKDIERQIKELERDRLSRFNAWLGVKGGDKTQ